VATRTETLQVSGIRCEQCVQRLAVALRDHEGLESASATLMGRVELTYDETLTTREVLLATMARAGFHEAPAV
jgi:copper chaperone CopZ